MVRLSSHLQKILLRLAAKGLVTPSGGELQNFKDNSKLLDRSLNTSVSSSSTDIGLRPHYKSMSDLSTIHAPTYAHSNTEPITTSKRHSPQPPVNALSETISVQNVTESSESSISTSPAVGDIRVPLLLQQGTPMTKVSLKRHKKFVFRLDADLGQIVWESNRHKIIPIENIKEIRSGEDARYYRQQFQLSQDYQDRWLTIIYLLDGNYKTLHLIPATKDVFRMGQGTPRAACHPPGANAHEDLFGLFKQADSRGRDLLILMIFVTSSFKRTSRHQSTLQQAQDDSRVYDNFMRNDQKSTLDSNDLTTLFTKYSTNVDNAVIMTLESFNAFLMSPDTCAFSDQHNNTWQDMTHPLSEYYISSSHNTYLVGHQLVGVSTLEGYIRALLHSCRSVEVDIYDGDQEPMVFHGKSFTSKVSLREVCEAILKYGFVASPYPIIISAEIHCSIGHQDLIAAIMIEIFGEKLVRMPLDGESDAIRQEDRGGGVAESRRIEREDTPQELELLEVDSSDRDGYYTDPFSSASDSGALTDMAQLDICDRESRDGATQSPLTEVRQLLNTRTSMLKRVRSAGKSSKPLSPPLPPLASSPVSSPTSPKSSVLASPFDFSQPSSSASKPRMSLALLSLLVYTVGAKCRGLNKKEEYAPSHMFSLSENVANKMMKFGMGELIKHTRTHLPHRFWAGGMQLVSINWQTFDLGYMINHPMFQRNGRSGYVLKPPAVHLSHKKDLLAQKTLHSFEVTIISAQQLPRPRDASGLEVLDKAIVDPYVEVTLYIPDWPVHVVGEDKGKKKIQETGDETDDKAGLNSEVTPPSTPLPSSPPGMSSTSARSIS
ncbi:PLC-like phosphodiesterase [Phlegmacium glaucopus]|nr:PLC-like phosphodiesterase [Phlegmacium glaucopus]